jgi:hypothetical protein
MLNFFMDNRTLILTLVAMLCMTYLISIDKLTIEAVTGIIAALGAYAWRARGRDKKTNGGQPPEVPTP